MKEKMKRIRIIVMSIVIMTLIFSMLNQTTTEAAGEKHMKEIAVRFDLKKNRSVKYDIKFTGVGIKQNSMKISNYKEKSSPQAGYKVISFDVTNTVNFKPSQNEVRKILDEKYKKKLDVLNHFYVVVLDYNSGLALARGNKHNVTVNYGTWKKIKDKYYYDGMYGGWVNFATKRIHVTVTCPKNYKNLCIGVGGCTRSVNSGKHSSFWNGKVPFGKSYLYNKKYKNSNHFMRVR